MNVSLRAQIIDSIRASNRRIIIESKPDRIILTRLFNKQPIRIELIINGNELWIEPPRYSYHSHISHYDYNEDERRWTRNKGVILSIISCLRTSGAWQYISNKNFFQVNENFTGKKRELAAIQEEFEAITRGKVKKVNALKALEDRRLLKSRLESLHRSMDHITSKYNSKDLPEEDFKGLAKSIREEISEITSQLKGGE